VRGSGLGLASKGKPYLRFPDKNPSSINLEKTKKKLWGRSLRGAKRNLLRNENNPKREEKICRERRTPKRKKDQKKKLCRDGPLGQDTGLITEKHKSKRKRTLGGGGDNNPFSKKGRWSGLNIIRVTQGKDTAR